MFAKSKQIGLVSLFVVAAATMMGCAESVGGGAPASFPSETRPMAFVSRPLPAPKLIEETDVAKSESFALRTDAKHAAAHPVAVVR